MKREMISERARFFIYPVYIYIYYVECTKQSVMYLKTRQICTNHNCYENL